MFSNFGKTPFSSSKSSVTGFGSTSNSNSFTSAAQLYEKQGGSLNLNKTSTSFATKSSFFGSSSQKPANKSPFQQAFTPTNSFSSFCKQNTQPGTVVKFVAPMGGSDVMIEGRISRNVPTKLSCITCMSEYEGRSLEELRWEDYQQGRKGSQTAEENRFKATPLGGINMDVGQTKLGQNSSNFNLQNQQNTSSPFMKSSLSFHTPLPSHGKLFGFSSTPTTSSTLPSTLNPMKSFLSPTSLPALSKPLSPANNSIFSKSNMFTASSPSPANMFGTAAAGQQKPVSFNANAGDTSFGMNLSGFNKAPAANVFNTSASSTLKPFSFSSPATTTAPTTSLSFGAFAPSSKSIATNNNNTFTSNMFAPNKNLFATSNNMFAANNNSFATNSSNTFATNSSTLQTNSPFATNNSMFATLSTPQSNQFSLQNAFSSQPVTANKPALFGSTLGNVSMFSSNKQAATFNASPQQQELHYREPQKFDADTVNNLLSPFGFSEHLKGLIPIIKEDIQRTLNIAEISIPIKKSIVQNDTIKRSSINSSTRMKPKELFDDALEEDEKHYYSKIGSNTSRQLHLKKPEKTLLKPSWSEIFNEGNLPRQTSVINNNVILITNQIIRKEKANDLESKKIEIVTTDKGVQTVGETVGDFSSNLTFDEETNIEDETYNGSLHESEGDHGNKCGVKLSRTGYYTIPPLSELTDYINDSGRCVVEGFTIGRVGFGNVYFPNEVDITGMNLDEIIHFRNKEVMIYPDTSKKPPIGEGLNQTIQITIDDLYPRDEADVLIKDEEFLTKINFAGKLKKLCEKKGTHFNDYRPETGSLVFTVVPS